MALGEVYVEVDASVVGGGIMPMAIISGNPEPIAGQESFGVWLLWCYNDEDGEGGFTGSGWYFDDPNNPISDLYQDEESFKQYLVKERPSNLDSVLGTWGSEKKSDFFNDNQSALAQNNCFRFIG